MIFDCIGAAVACTLAVRCENRYYSFGWDCVRAHRVCIQ